MEESSYKSKVEIIKSKQKNIKLAGKIIGENIANNLLEIIEKQKEVNINNGIELSILLTSVNEAVVEQYENNKQKLEEDFRSKNYNQNTSLNELKNYIDGNYKAIKFKDSKTTYSIVRTKDNKSNLYNEDTTFKNLKDFELLNQINKLKLTSGKFNNICYKEKVYLDLESKELINKEELESLIYTNEKAIIRDIENNTLIDLEKFVMDDSIKFSIYEGDKVNYNDTHGLIVIRDTFKKKTEFIEVNTETEQYDVDIIDYIDKKSKSLLETKNNSEQSHLETIPDTSHLENNSHNSNSHKLR